MENPVEIFFSYAHEDESLMHQVRRQLVVFDRMNVIRKWHGRRIPPGAEWQGQIDEHLNSAQIILLFISPDFFESDYCYDVEMQAALSRHNSGQATVIPIILRPCPWKTAPFGHIQALPTDGRPVTTWSNADEACLDIANGVMGVVRAESASPGSQEALPFCGSNAAQLVAAQQPAQATRRDLTVILGGHESERTSEGDHFGYRSHTQDGQLVIQPDVTYLNEIRSGGVIQPLDFWYSPWARKFTFPALDIKLVNNSSHTVFFHEAVFRITRSRIDPRPIPIICGTGYHMHLPLKNIGWGPMRNCMLRFALGNGDPADDFPFELALGEIDQTSEDISLRNFFARLGVDLEKLAELETIWSNSFGSESLMYLDGRWSLGESFDWMRGSQYQELQRKALGPFPNGQAVVSGELEYSQVDSTGGESRQINKLIAPVSILGPPDGAPRPPTYSYNVRFKVDGDSYEVTVPISQAIGVGEVDRFLIHIATDKSSLHEFDLLLRYNETEEIVTRPIRLELFLSRLDAQYVNQEARDV